MFSISGSPIYAVDAGADCNIFNVIGIGITQGKLPYRDLFDHKGPLLFYIYAFAHLIKTPKIGLFCIQVIFLYISVCFQFKISECFLDKTKSLITVLMTLLFVSYSIGDGGTCEFFELPFIYISIYFLVKFYIHNGNYSLLRLGLIEGVCFGSVFLIRINDAVGQIGIPIFCCACYIIYIGYYKRLFRAILGFLLGFIVVSSPFILYFGCHGVLGEAWDAMFTFNLKYAAYDLTNNNTLRLLMLSFFILSALLTLKRNISDNIITLFLLLPVLLGSVFLLGKNAYEHYYMVLTPMFGILLCLLYNKYYLSLTFWILFFGGFNIGSGVALEGSLYQKIHFDYKIMKNNSHYKQLIDEYSNMLKMIPDDERSQIWNYNINHTYLMNFYTHYGVTPCNKYFVPFHKTLDETINYRENIFDYLPTWVTVIEDDEFINNTAFDQYYENKYSFNFEGLTISLLKLTK